MGKKLVEIHDLSGQSKLILLFSFLTREGNSAKSLLTMLKPKNHCLL